MLDAALVKKIAKEIGFDLVGITGARPMTELAALLEERRKTGLWPPFVSAQVEERLDPGRLLPGAQAVIMVALNYYYPLAGPAAELGLSRSTLGTDYHLVLGAMLEKLGQKLQEIEPGLRYRKFVDTGPLLERELARRAGLGWIGKNTNLLTPSFGSWVFLGGLVVNRELEEDRPLPRDCGDCTRCLEACPAGALEGPYRLNPHRCLSYLTQKKGFLTGEERERLGGRVYGCDTCQAACPVNAKGARVTQHEAFQPRWPQDLSLADLALLDNATFRRLFGQSTLAWRGKTNLKRNAVIALGLRGERDALPVLAQALQDASPVVRGQAAWALGRLTAPEAPDLLERALAGEKDPRVVQELQRALAALK